MRFIVSKLWVLGLGATLVVFRLQADPAELPISPLLAARDVAAFETQESERLARAQSAIQAILAIRGLRTIENTLTLYDEAFNQLDAANNIANISQNVQTDTAFRDAATAMLNRANAANVALTLNREVYQALAAINLTHSDSATHYYVNRRLLEFRLAGVDKDDAVRAKVQALNEQLGDEQSRFSRNISDDRSFIDIAANELAGLPQDYLDRHKQAADGTVRLTVRYTDFFPVITFAENAEVRRRLMTAFVNRGYPGNEIVVKQMLQTRYEIARLLGYTSWADYSAAGTMIGSGEHIASFIQQLDKTVRPFANRELGVLLAEKRKSIPDAKELWNYDNWYYPELVRRAQYDFDSRSLRPYFPFQQVQQGVLDTAARFFGVTFRKEMGVAAWDPSVETWDVVDQEKVIGRFFLDLHPRKNKYTHNAAFPVLAGIRGRQLPEAVLICNFPAPSASDPGLTDYTDVVTFFHEFGHLMHHILGGNQAWAGISGIRTESDFVEAPSQMLEELMSSPKILASFARHYQTGEPIPQELVVRLNRASTFGRARQTELQNAFSAISYDLHKTDPARMDLDTVCSNDIERYSTIRLSPGVHFCASFDHLSVYGSSYYKYSWDKVIAEAFFARFNHDDPASGDAPSRYRRFVLEPGGSMPATNLVKNFLGRPQQMNAFAAWLTAEFN